MVNTELNDGEHLTKHGKKDCEEKHEGFEVHDDLADKHDNWREWWENPQKEECLLSDHHYEYDHDNFARYVLGL